MSAAGEAPVGVTMEIDVSDAAGLGTTVHTCATILLPDPASLTNSPIVVFAMPGAGYSRRYFTFDMPGASDGGQAGWHARRGWIFVALDTLGVGDASQPDASSLELPVMTAVGDATVAEVLRRLASGSVRTGYPEIVDPVVLGIGQSMGGGLTIVQQAHHGTFDGIGVLGFSAVWTTARGFPGGPPQPTAYLTRDRRPEGPDIFPHEIRARAAVNSALLRLQGEPGRYLKKETAPPAWNYHYDDVPPEIVERDFTFTGDVAEWRSTTTPGAVLWMIGPGAVAPEAAAIVVPVLSAFGERDVPEDPRMEHKAFRHAVDFSSFVCPRMGHMHNFASTRELLWSRIHHWGEHVADLKRRLPQDWPAQLFSDSY